MHKKRNYSATIIVCLLLALSSIIGIVIVAMKERIHKAVSYSKLKIDWASKEDDLLFQEYGENDTRLN
jgi:hypothetical protein